MGVSVNQYLIYGVKLTFDELSAEKREYLHEFTDNPYNSEMNPKKGLIAIIDGMCEEYIYFGQCLQKAEDGEYLESVSVDKLKNYESEFTKSCIKCKTGVDKEPSLHFVTLCR